VAVLVPSSFRSEDYISISERYKYKAWDIEGQTSILASRSVQQDAKEVYLGWLTRREQIKL
jgi:hypothetical protein